MGKSRDRKGRGQKAGTNLTISEAASAKIRNALRQFHASDAQGYTFQDELNNFERRFVHSSCRKYGMTSKSTGVGKERRVSVYKSDKPKKKEEGENAKKSANFPSLKFSKEAREVLEDVFIRYPPSENEGCGVGPRDTQKPETSFRKPDELFLKPLMSSKEIAHNLKSLAHKMRTLPQMKQITEIKSRLPITSFKDEITSTVESNQVVLISGETGCGKTTQVPQFMLDHMWGKGESCKLVCTQPRRISAISVSERISSERGEDIGESVGYKIRLESKGGRHSSIVFCTNGILLRVLVSKGLKTGATKSTNSPTISQITHIIVDEIHERDHYSDFMLAILRDMLTSYPNLRLILMSATLDAERFSQYFGGCPIIRIPGFTYPVKTFYLEDVLSLLKEGNNQVLNSASRVPPEESGFTEEDKVVLDEAIDSAWLNDEFDSLLELVSEEGTRKVYNYQHSSTGLTPLMLFASKGRVGDVITLLALGADCQLRASDGATALDLAEREAQKETADILKEHMKTNPSNTREEKGLLEKYYSAINPDFTDIVLIEKLLTKICTDSEEGAILVFLPGWDDINKIHDKLRENRLFNDPSKFDILSLHSMIPSTEQKKVFNRPPPGCRKIVLSTNIAETSITIDDVVYVIDSGRLKEKGYDPYSNVLTLQSSWVSKASAKQREGRAGRCQPGVCYHLCSRVRAASLPEFQVPEIMRMPVEELCLQVKLIDPNCSIDGFLRKTMDPPAPETIRNAITVLQDIGALSPKETITELGERLGSFPLHPLTSKMLFFAILMNCLDPALTIACAADCRDPFTLPMLPSEKKKADAAKAELAALFGGRSDQLAVVAAFECWRNAMERGDENYFCSKYYVSSARMKILSATRTQLHNELKRTGLIPEDLSQCSLNARDPGILHAVLLSGLYPMVGRLLPPNRPGRPIFVDTPNSDKVRVHPASVNSKLQLKKADSPLIMYDQITRGDFGMLIRNCTVVGPMPLLFLSTELSVVPAQDNDDDDDDDDDEDNDGDSNDEDEEQEGDDIGEKMTSEQKSEKLMSSPDNSVVVVVDRWLYFQSTALDVAQIYLLRERLCAAILFKVKHPREFLPPVLGASMYAIACILSYDGLSEVSSMPEPMDSLTKMVNATEINDSGKGMSESRLNPSVYIGTLFTQATRSLLHPKNRASKSKSKSNSRDSSGPTGQSGARHHKNGGSGPKGDLHKRQRGNGAD